MADRDAPGQMVGPNGERTAMERLDELQAREEAAMREDEGAGTEAPPAAGEATTDQITQQAIEQTTVRTGDGGETAPAGDGGGGPTDTGGGTGGGVTQQAVERGDVGGGTGDGAATTADAGGDTADTGDGGVTQQAVEQAAVDTGGRETTTGGGRDRQRDRDTGDGGDGETTTGGGDGGMAGTAGAAGAGGATTAQEFIQVERGEEIPEGATRQRRLDDPSAQGFERARGALSERGEAKRQQALDLEQQVLEQSAFLTDPEQVAVRSGPGDTIQTELTPAGLRALEDARASALQRARAQATAELTFDDEIGGAIEPDDVTTTFEGGRVTAQLTDEGRLEAAAAQTEGVDVSNLRLSDGEVTLTDQGRLRATAAQSSQFDMADLVLDDGEVQLSDLAAAERGAALPRPTPTPDRLTIEQRTRRRGGTRIPGGLTPAGQRAGVPVTTGGGRFTGDTLPAPPPGTTLFDIRDRAVEGATATTRDGDVELTSSGGVRIRQGPTGGVTTIQTVGDERAAEQNVVDTAAGVAGAVTAATPLGTAAAEVRRRAAAGPDIPDARLPDLGRTDPVQQFREFGERQEEAIFRSIDEQTERVTGIDPAPVREDIEAFGAPARAAFEQQVRQPTIGAIGGAAGAIRANPAAAAAVAAAEPTPFGEAALLGTLAAGALVADTARRAEQTEIPVPETPSEDVVSDEVEAPEDTTDIFGTGLPVPSETRFDRPELLVPSDRLEVGRTVPSELSVPSDPGDPVQPTEIGVPDVGVQAQQLIQRDPEEITDPTRQRRGRDVPEEFIPDEPVEIGRDPEQEEVEPGDVAPGDALGIRISGDSRSLIQEVIETPEGDIQLSPEFTVLRRDAPGQDVESREIQTETTGPATTTQPRGAAGAEVQEPDNIVEEFGQVDVVGDDASIDEGVSAPVDVDITQPTDQRRDITTPTPGIPEPADTDGVTDQPEQFDPVTPDLGTGGDTATEPVTDVRVDQLSQQVPGTGQTPDIGTPALTDEPQGPDLGTPTITETVDVPQTPGVGDPFIPSDPPPRRRPDLPPLFGDLDETESDDERVFEQRFVFDVGRGIDLL